MKHTRVFLTLFSILALGGLAASEGLAKSVEPKEETYQAPKQGKQRLAYCYEPDKGCGKKAADAWCKTKGYKTAKEWKVLEQNGRKVKATRYIGSEGTCRARGCHTFESITCRMGPPTFF
ncbi:MAG: hypothetical protein IT573_08850 [Deltaproteobacteria bacterium]|nr:hypothetical protein [Deltaproteobacteria bacterium]